MLEVEDGSRTAEARAAARELARTLGFNATNAERAAIISTEACTNLLKHAGGGKVVISASAEDSQIELLALDRGPGIENLSVSLRDGHSTTNTSGTGLGAIYRLSAFVDVYSQPGSGTVVYAVISNDGAKVSSPAISAVRAAKPGEMVCGDDWGMERNSHGNTIVIADGLGHGPEAATASRTAIEILHRRPDLAPKDMLEAVHLGLRHTRGAAVAVAGFDEERRTLDFAGLGNISAHILEKDGSSKQMVSMNGTAGIEGRNVFREFKYPWPEGAVVVLHSDGLTTRWNLKEYPGVISRGAGVIAGVLFRDSWRGTDDGTVVVAACR